MQVPVHNPTPVPPHPDDKTTATLPDGRYVQWPQFYFGARNGIPPWGIQDANAYYGTSMANTQRFVADSRHPMISQQDYQWAGTYPKNMWDPLYYFRGYPTAPIRAPIDQGIFIRAVPQHNELGYQMVYLRDNGVPIGGTPETTPQYVFAGPVQIGYMSAVRPIARREQMPGTFPPRTPNPEANPPPPPTANIFAAAQQAGYGVYGGGPYSTWPATGAGFYPVRNAVMGDWPTFMYAPVGPAQLPITKPPPTACANTNPGEPEDQTMRHQDEYVGHPATPLHSTDFMGHAARVPAWADPVAYKRWRSSLRKRHLPNPLGAWGGALLGGVLGLGAGGAAAAMVVRPRVVHTASTDTADGTLTRQVVLMPGMPETYDSYVGQVRVDHPDGGATVLATQAFVSEQQAVEWVTKFEPEPPSQGDQTTLRMQTGNPYGLVPARSPTRNFNARQQRFPGLAIQNPIPGSGPGYQGLMNTQADQNGAGYGPGGYNRNPAGLAAAPRVVRDWDQCMQGAKAEEGCNADSQSQQQYDACIERAKNRCRLAGWPEPTTPQTGGFGFAAPTQSIQQQLAAEGVSWPLPPEVELRPIPGTSRMMLCCRYEGGECCEVGSGGCFGIITRCLRGRVKGKGTGSGAGVRPLGTIAARPWSGMGSSTRASIGQLVNPDACCESCAFGGHCEGGCGEDCDCDRKGNPASNP